MLELRPSCEYCDRDLPFDSAHAYICTYECTFCKDCVDNILSNVCPNCGGGFSQRPIRPTQEYRSGVSVKCQPPSAERKHAKYTREQIKEFSDAIKSKQANKR
ncbi:DUF1272 domain-containing protein [Aliikangiella sp. IMCC44632]